MGETPGVYIHIPFCASRCDYCDFYTVTRRGDLFEPYTEAVCRAVATAPLEAGREVGSVYFGGGTPALLGPKRLGKMLAAVAKRWVLAPDAEITLEANPGAVTGAALRGFREAGFNRLSLGVQSGVDGRLRDLGRIHTAGGAAETVRLAREAGFENLTLDLMLGLPGQGGGGRAALRRIHPRACAGAHLLLSAPARGGHPVCRPLPGGGAGRGEPAGGVSGGV